MTNETDPTQTNPSEVVEADKAVELTQDATTALGGVSEEIEAKSTDGQEVKATEEVEKTEVVGAPEEYEAFVVPEGIELNGEVTDEFKALAKEQNLTQANAQKLIDLATKHSQALQERMLDLHVQQIATWGEESKADPEIGGAKYTENVKLAQNAIERFGTPALREALEFSGLGNHPELIRAFTRIGKAISESSLHGIGAAPSAGRELSLAERMYPTQS